MESVHIPTNYPTSMVYVDESGTASNGRFFVVGALKVRNHGRVLRRARSVREKYGYRHEFRFNRVQTGNLAMYRDLVDVVLAGDTVLFGTVVDRTLHDPSAGQRARWQAHADVTIQLVTACINRQELVSVTMDLIDTPPDVAIEDYVRRGVHQRLHCGSLVTATSHDSRSTDGLQLVDMFAGAVAHERRRLAGGRESTSSPKGQLVEHIKRGFNVSALDDARTRRLCLLTLDGRRKRAVTPLLRKGSRAPEVSTLLTRR